MSTASETTVDKLILERLKQATLSEKAKNLIIAALWGSDHLASALEGKSFEPPPQSHSLGASEHVASGTFLTSIEVTGFRGIGKTATLHLPAGPGLTLVVGRNGSGKSSFAEAAEFALTGDNKRWSGRSATWREGWRNLHAQEDGLSPRIEVGLRFDGRGYGATVTCEWTGDAGLDGCSTTVEVPGKGKQSISDLGWKEPLELYRPFLSYSELGGLLSGKPTEMHDSLQRVLGLGRLVELEGMLKEARKNKDNEQKAAGEQLPRLRAELAMYSDPRAREVEALLSDKVPDLDRLEELATVDDAADAVVLALRQIETLALPARDDIVATVGKLRQALREIDRLAGTPVEEARTIASLLEGALRHFESHPNQLCPVCQGRELDQAWAEQARREHERLTRRADQLVEAQKVEKAARQALREWVPVRPPATVRDLNVEGVDTSALLVAWQHWGELIGGDDAGEIADHALAAFDALAAALCEVQAAARKAREGRERAWRPAADRIRQWVASARKSREAAEMYRELHSAVVWLQKVSTIIRNQRLEPLAAETKRIWAMLRHESNVDLSEIQLVGAGPKRHVQMGITVDGVPGAALGVMSQGELHSLALALFLPRATMAESPFRFLVIDDPVQSMDPAKVYGLAHVLAEVAKTRQVIVFTHDDRLPTAVRHLQLPARIITVSRREGSQVEVSSDKDGNPAKRHLKDARAITQDAGMDPEVRALVVCSLVREAIEVTCKDLTYMRALREGIAITDIEDLYNAANSVREKLALALLGDAKRHEELSSILDKVDHAASRVVKAANKGVHGDELGSLPELVKDAERLVQRLVTFSEKGLASA